MILKADISVLMFDDCSVFVVVVIKNRERERDDGQRTLATCTFLKSQFRCGVVNMLLVHVRVQGVKRSFVFVA